MRIMSFLPYIASLGVLMGTPATAFAQAESAPDSSAENGRITIQFVGKDQYGATPVEIHNGTIFFKAVVANRDIWMVLDNGASNTILDEAVAKQAGYRTTASTMSFKTMQGEIVGHRLDDGAVTIPPQFSVTGNLFTFDLSEMEKFLGRPIGGILGADVLSRFALIFDTDGQRFTLAPSGKVTPREAHIVFPLVKPAKIAAKVSNQSLLLSVDLGYNGQAAIRDTTWHRLGLTTEPLRKEERYGADGSSRTTPTVVISEMSFGPLQVRDFPAEISEMNDELGDGVIGMGLLNRFNFILDISAGKLLLTPRQPLTSAREASP